MSGSPAGVLQRLLECEKRIDDPGDAGTIRVDRNFGVVALQGTTGAQTRTMPDPEDLGIRCTLAVEAITSGTITVTFSSAYDEAGTTTMPFSATGQSVDLVSVPQGARTYVWRVVGADGVVMPVFDVTTLKIGGTSVLATAAEINRAADMSTRIVDCTASTLAVTEADHDGKIITLNRAAGIAVTLPTPAAGMRFEFIVQTTFTGAASIKSGAGTHVMIGHALLGNDSDNTVVLWQALAASTYDTIDLFGTANSTGGIAGQRIVITGLSTTRWHVEITGDAAGTEATPFADTVA